MRFLLALLVAIAIPDFASDQTYTLTDKKSSFVFLESGYPKGDFDLDLLATCKAPGRILDTAGIDSAPQGSFCLEILQTLRVVFHVFDGSKWENLVSKNGVTIGREARIHIIRKDGTVTMSIDGLPQGSQAIGTPLSGARIFVGDYKGDERFGTGYDIYQAMTGNVRVTYFGELRIAKASKPMDAILKPGSNFIYFQPEAKLYMIATFGAGTVRAHCSTADDKAPRDFEGALKSGVAKDSVAYGSSTFLGGGGGEVFYQFDSGGQNAATLWRPLNGPTKWFVWIRVAKVGDTKMWDSSSSGGSR